MAEGQGADGNANDIQAALHAIGDLAAANHAQAAAGQATAEAAQAQASMDF